MGSLRLKLKCCLEVFLLEKDMEPHPEKKRRSCGRDRAIVYLIEITLGQMLRPPLLPVVADSLHWTKASEVQRVFI